MMKTKWLLIILLLVMIGLPQRTSAQSPCQKIFDTEDAIYTFDWSPDNRWLIVGSIYDEQQYFDLETRTLHSEQPEALKHELSAEECAYLHVADDATISISPDGRYVLYDSSDPVPIPEGLTGYDREEFQMLNSSLIYLADRQTRKYALWTAANGLVGVLWSPDSSGMLIWRGYWEIAPLAGYVTGFREDVM